MTVMAAAVAMVAETGSSILGDYPKTALSGFRIVLRIILDISYSSLL